MVKKKSKWRDSQIIKQASDKITKAMKQNGVHTHNRLCFILRDVAENVSYDAANDLIDKHSITELYGIDKVYEKSR